MTERPKGGPIRRKAGERRRAREEQRAAVQQTLQSDTAKAPGQRPPTKPPQADTEARTPTRRAKPALSGGRRVFEPQGRTSSASVTSARPVVSARPAAAQTPRPSTPKTPSKNRDAGPKVKTAAQEQEAARVLAADKGIPQVHALRVVRGEVSLNVILKNLMRKERAIRLVERDGMDPGLAGQVASGHLSRERAIELQRIRQHRTQRIDRDALKLAELDQSPIAVSTFGDGWLTGLVSEARTYEFDIVPEGGSKAVYQKHDIKVVCAFEDLNGVQSALEVDEGVRDTGLVGSADRGDRVRPKDSAMLDLIEGAVPIRCVLRDGDAYRGTLASFGRWDLSMTLSTGEKITVLFHALHQSNDWIA